MTGQKINLTDNPRWWLVKWDFIRCISAYDSGSVYLNQDFISDSIDTSKISISYYMDNDKSICDFPFYRIGIFLTNARGLEFMKTLMPESTHIFRVRSEVGEMFIVDCREVLPGFDQSRSLFEAYEQGGIKRVRTFYVTPDFTSPFDVFRLEGGPAVSYQVFVSERFRKAYDAAALTGLVFRGVLT